MCLHYLLEARWGEGLQKVSNIPKHVHDLYATATGEILFNGTSTYAEYIFIVSTIMQVIHELRNDYSYEFYQRIYENLEWDEAKVMRERFSYRVVEIPIE